MIGRILAAGLTSFLVITMGFAQFGNTGNSRYRTIASGANSSETRQTIAHALDQTTFENYLQICRVPNRPTVDFTKDRVAIIFLGQRSTGGYSASIRSVTVANDIATINVLETTPAPGSMQTQALTSPWVMVALDRSVLDFKLNITQMAAQPLPTGGGGGGWFPCRFACRYDGYWDAFRNPFGQIFYTETQYFGWTQSSGFVSPNFSFNFSQYAFGMVSIGRASVGYSTSLERVVATQNGIARALVRRRSTTEASQGARWFGVELPRTIRSITTEYFDDASLVLAYRGEAMFTPSLIGQAVNPRSLRLESSQLKGFDPNRETLLQVTVAPERRKGWKFEGLQNRNGQAIALFSRTATDPSAKAETFLIRAPRGTQSAIVEELPSAAR